MNKLGTAIPTYQPNRAEMFGSTPQNPGGYPQRTSPVETPTGPTPAAPTSPMQPPTQPTGGAPNNPYDQFYGQYGADSAPMRRLLGVNGQNNIDMWHDQGDTQATGGSDGGGGSAARSPQMQDMIDKGYMHYVQDSGGDAGGGHYELDQSKIPANKYGNIGVSAYDPSMRLMNDAYKYNDPNYGWITPTANVDSRAGIWDSIYQYAPALFTMGMGAMAAPVAGLGMAGNIASKLPSLAQQFGNGNFNAGGLLSSVGGMLTRGGGGGGP